MKKIILLILIISQTLHLKAQLAVCDSVSYTIGGGQGGFNVTLNTTGLTNIVDSMDILWSVCNTSICYTAQGTTASFQNILQTDTVKACYDVYIYIDTISYVCNTCDSLLYDGNSWELFSAGNSTEIEESAPYVISEFYPNPASEIVYFAYYLILVKIQT